MTRELKQYFRTPSFYVLAAIFLAFSGYRFYSLILSYMDFMTSYPEYIFGGEISALMGLNPNTFIFPRLFEYYSYLIVVSIPVLSILTAQDLNSNLDKIELSCSSSGEYTYFLRKAISSCIVLFAILLPTIIYPLILWVFTSIDFGLIFSSYIGLFFLVIFSSFISLPALVTSMPLFMGLFLNLTILLLAHNYVLMPLISQFLYGLVSARSIASFLILSLLLLIISVKLYQYKRVYT